MTDEDFIMCAHCCCVRRITPTALLRRPQGIYDYLIATDASTEEIIKDDEDDGDKSAEDAITAAAAEDGADGSGETDMEAKGKKRKKKKAGKAAAIKKKDGEYNTARGLDFQSVSAVGAAPSSTQC